MHRRTLRALVAPLVIALTAIGLTAFANSSSAVATSRTVSTANIYNRATCTVTIDELLPLAVFVKAHITAQSFPSALGVGVKSTVVGCGAYDASGAQIGSFDVSGNGALILPQRKDFTWAVSTGYRVCVIAVETLYSGKTVISQLRCSATV